MAEPYDEKEQLRAFVLCIASRMGTSDDALVPIRKTTSLRGLREAARDMVEWCRDFDPAQRAEIDSELRSAGLPSVAFMQHRARARFSKVLARGVIIDEDEYRLLDELVSDLESGLDAEARARAEQLLAHFAADD